MPSASVCHRFSPLVARLDSLPEGETPSWTPPMPVVADSQKIYSSCSQSYLALSAPLRYNWQEKTEEDTLPKKKQSNQFREKATTVRLTQLEWSQLKREAEDLNLSFSDYARRILLERPLPRIHTQLEIDTYRELIRIGTNVNQLATAANRAVKMGTLPAVTQQQWLELYQLIKSLGLELIG